ncbi:DNA-binding transcriptional repressor [Pasteurella atlantica]|uniref:glucitol operon DNA-binding transcriptional repressor SrlR n=1 Tax=Pasteurellaceae TaxID=712 RepID=UPI00275AC86D|nr:DNA-binding transcriptional repressor [Pasteurella atlantica]MDP8033384.1 DNA-binding transcriptional repressor [Pasteurella atlantica]MDP8035320.1 DNA-binding transcriptional repressor [Pasteurella atlantica]MDP8037270.1 DNA-binding transcriptional repressor [Pasteurella atlantica]MDP8047616.1 DNA-binding transcriptional repressor [Pasteurella atlantica]MDP8049573.1 DNA-binding transcriptional repressor [Pasteurella atlantica]
MKPVERQKQIIEYLQQNGKTSVEILAQNFNTTGATIRKDLTILENSGKVLRTYGSVLLASNDEDRDLPILSKSSINLEIKKKIAKQATMLIEEGDSIIMDTGSTVLQMIPFLSSFDNLTIMTNSLHIINSLVNLDKDYSLLISSGTFRPKSGSFHGTLAESTFENFSFNKLFIGADSIDLNSGLTTFNEVHGVSKAMCKAASKIIVLADSSKFGRRSPNIVCPLDQIDIIITDTKLDKEIYNQLIKNNINVVLVE